MASVVLSLYSASARAQLGFLRFLALALLVSELLLELLKLPVLPVLHLAPLLLATLYALLVWGLIPNSRFAAGRLVATRFSPFLLLQSPTWRAASSSRRFECKREMSSIRSLSGGSGGTVSFSGDSAA